MIHTPLPKFRTTFGFITLICGLITTSQTFSASMENMSDSTDKQGVGKVLGISGWYERYGNGQIVLYPIVNLPTKEGMYTMGNMYGMVSMFPMYSMGMLGMGGPYSMAMMGGMLGMSMKGMNSNMTGMAGLAKMYGMLDMYGLSGGYQMAFGRFWINDEGQLVLYPVSNMSGMGSMMGMGSMTGMSGMGGMGGMKGMQ